MGLRAKKKKRWARGIIPYEFRVDETKPALRPGLKATFVACMRRWERFLNLPIPLIEFRPRRNDEMPYLRIDLTDFSEQCSTSCDIGMPSEGFAKFTFNLYRQDEDKSIPHELGHCLGLGHEHLRNDPADLATWQQMDDPHLYPVDQWALIAQQDHKQNYNHVGTFDIWSLMQYPSATGWKWSREAWNQEQNRGQVLAATNYPTLQEVKANLWQPSPGDIAALQELYTLP
jgi:hypothetical protein